MARLFDTSLSQYMSCGSVPVTGTPMTVSAWVYPTSIPSGGVGRAVMTLGSSTNDYWLLWIQTFDNQWVWAEKTSAAGYQATTSQAVSLNTWQLITGISVSSTQRRLFFNGSSVGDNTTSMTHTTADTFEVGRFLAPNHYFDGRIAELAIWNSALSDAEVATLYNGGVSKSPWNIQPSWLVAHYKFLDADGDIDWAGDGTYDLTPVNSPTYGAHPPTTMWLPKSAILTFSPAAAGGDITVQPSVLNISAALQTPTHIPSVSPNTLNVPLVLPSPVPAVAKLPSALDLLVSQQTPTPKVDIAASTLLSPVSLQAATVLAGDVNLQAEVFSIPVASQNPIPKIDLTPSILNIPVSEQSPAPTVQDDPITFSVPVSTQSPTPIVTVLPDALDIDVELQSPFANEWIVTPGVTNLSIALQTLDEFDYTATPDVQVVGMSLRDLSVAIDINFTVGLIDFLQEDTWEITLLEGENVVITSGDYIELNAYLKQTSSLNYNIATGATVKASLITKGIRSNVLGPKTLVEDTAWSAGSNLVTVTWAEGETITASPVLLEIQVEPADGKTRTFFSEAIQVNQDTIEES